MVSLAMSVLGVNLEDMCKDNCSDCNEHGPNHPQNKRSLLEEIQQLRQAMSWFTEGPKSRNGRCAGAGKDGADEREAGERFLEKQGRESRVEYQTGLQPKRTSAYVGTLES
jgi:hypothetical protein